MGKSFDSIDNSFFFSGQNDDPDFVTTVATSYIFSSATIVMQVLVDDTGDIYDPRYYLGRCHYYCHHALPNLPTL